MAISNLVSPGQSSERPSVSAFFGQSYTSGATQKVSSTMMSDSFVDSTMNMLKGLTTEIARIQATAKKTLAGFDKFINSIRELNRSITMRFRTLNNELTASRVDFLRGGIIHRRRSFRPGGQRCSPPPVGEVDDELIARRFNCGLIYLVG